jgi:hypothetical protein
MVKGQRQTRKVRSTSRKTDKVAKSGVLTIPQLRKAFDHMDKVVESLRKVAKHSFSDAVVTYREEWRKTFKRDLSPADAAAYLKFRFGMKRSAHTRRSKTRGGGGLALAGAPLDYMTRPGVSGVYGQFPTYQTQGLDRYYGSAISADCGKPNGFPTDGSAASQAGGSITDALFRPILNGAPPGAPYTQMMEMKGVTPFPTSDPVGAAPLRAVPVSHIAPNDVNPHIRTFGADVYKTAASPAGLWHK